MSDMHEAKDRPDSDGGRFEVAYRPDNVSTLLNRFKERYETVCREAYGLIEVRTKVKGVDEFCYINQIDVQRGVFYSEYNFRKRFEDSLSDFTYDGDSAGVPLHLSDIMYCQIQVAAETFGADFHLTEIVALKVQNKKTVETINSLVASDDSKTFARGTESYSALMATPSGKSKKHFVDQYYPGKVIHKIIVDRSFDDDEDEVGKIQFIIV